jgi:hypothetical protein
LKNLIIAGTGALFRIVLGVGGSIWLASHMALSRMNPEFVCAGAVIVPGLSHLAVIWLAINAASIPPVTAIRGRKAASIFGY